MLQLRIFAVSGEFIVPIQGAKTPKDIATTSGPNGFMIGTKSDLIFAPKDAPWVIEEAAKDTTANVIKVGGVEMEIDQHSLGMLIKCLDQGLGEPPFFKHAGEARKLLKDFKAMAKECAAAEKEKKS